MAENPTFGQWLRNQRRELDLTQDALSREIGCAQITIRKIEADQLRPSQQMAKLLVKRLVTPPEKREQYIRFARTGELPLQVSVNLPPNNLPHALSSFVGRTLEIDEVHHLLGSSRLLTLIGAGGIGKTRLALQAAAGAQDQFSQGLWFVELAALVDSNLISQFVAGTMGLQNSGGASYESILIHHLLDLHTLIILDNCEHVLGSCAQLALTILQRCPKVTILATSRQRLGVPGEKLFRIPSLAAYDPKIVANLDGLEQTDSIRLFVERATAILPGFRLTSESLLTVARICHRLDGIPLAIELAAAWVSTLSVEQIANFLDGQFRLLTNGSHIALPRHRTMRASIDWSYNLLTAPERLLLQRLSVFSGGWTLDAAKTVCSSAGLEVVEILDILNSLEMKSLIVVDTLSGAQARYHVLESIRQYAAEKLTEGNLGDDSQAATLRDRHLAYFLALSRELGPKLHTAHLSVTLQRLELETDNLRAAITWGLTKGNHQDAEDVLGILIALDYFWAMRALYWETFPRFLRALEQLPNESNFSIALKARGLYVLSRLQVDFNIGTETLNYLNQSVNLFRQTGNCMDLMQALALRCYIVSRHIFFFPPDPAFCEENALRDKQECLMIMNELSMSPDNKSQNALAWVNCWIGARELFHGILAESKFYSERSQVKFKQLGDYFGELYGWGVHLYACLNTNGGRELLPSINQALDLASRFNLKWFQSHFHQMKARVYYYIGETAEFETNIKQCFVLSQQVGSIREQNNLSVMFGDYYTTRQDYPKALFYLSQTLNQLYRGAGCEDLYLTLETLSVLAELAVQIQQIQLAVKLLGFIEFRLDGFSKKYGGFNLTRFEQSRDNVSNLLDEDPFQVDWNQGRAMTIDMAVALALEIRVR